MREKRGDHALRKHLKLLQARRSLLEEEGHDFPEDLGFEIAMSRWFPLHFGSSDTAFGEEMLPPCFEIAVSRSAVLEESYTALQAAPPVEFLAPLTVRYLGEEGQDRGGVTQDWFSAVGRALTEGAQQDDSESVFCVGKSSRMLIPRPVGPCGDREKRFRDLFLAGRFLALAVLHSGQPLPLPLSPLVCKYMVGKPIDLEEMPWTSSRP